MPKPHFVLQHAGMAWPIEREELYLMDSTGATRLITAAEVERLLRAEMGDAHFENPCKEEVPDGAV